MTYSKLNQKHTSRQQCKYTLCPIEVCFNLAKGIQMSLEMKTQRFKYVFLNTHKGKTWIFYV